MLKTKYRVNRDSFYSYMFAVNYKLWWWPWWIEHGNGMLMSKQEAIETIKMLKERY